MLVRKSRYKAAAKTSNSASESPRILSDDQPVKRNWLVFITFPVYMASGIVGAFLLYRSYGLFQIAFNSFGLISIRDRCLPIALIPFIGQFLFFGCSELANLIVGSIALISLIALSILEVIPAFLYFHPGSIKGMVAQLRAHRAYSERLTPQAEDSAEVRHLVSRHNSLKDRTLRRLTVCAGFALAIEAVIVWIARGGRGDIWTVLTDSLALEALVIATLAFASAFRFNPPKARIYGR